MFCSSDVIMKHGVCIRVLGDLELLPKDVLESVARAVNFSRHNNKAFLNVCFSYTSRHEMTEAIRRLARGAQEEMIIPRCEINKGVLSKMLQEHCVSFLLVTFLRIYFKGACTLVTLHLLTWSSGLLEK